MTAINDTSKTAANVPDDLRAAGLVSARNLHPGTVEFTMSRKNGTLKDKPFFATVLPDDKDLFFKDGGLIVCLREGQEKSDRLEVWERIAAHYDTICAAHPTIKPSMDAYLSGQGGTQ